MAFRMLYGWSTPLAKPFSAISANFALGTNEGCLARRQGRCPGATECADCPWNEGSMVDGTWSRAGRSRR